MIASVISPKATLLVAVDASFVPKSGKKTYGLDKFFNGCAGRAQKGLEVSLVSLIDVNTNTAYALSVSQTPPTLKVCKSQGERATACEATRMDAYLKHLQEVRPQLPQTVRYGVFDGAYAKERFVHGVCDLGLQVVSKLRCDANLRYSYSGKQKKRGARRKYQGKVAFDQNHLTQHWQALGEVEPHLRLFTVVAYHWSLHRWVRVVLLLWDKEGKAPDKPRFVLLFSTDVDLSGFEVYRFYKARFQIEFLFRDAKQWTGLTECQSRQQAALHFHFNASLAAVNLAKVTQAQSISAKIATARGQDVKVSAFSLASWKQRAFNDHLLNVFIENLALEPSWVKSHPRYAFLCNYGAIAS
jgi:hypothetical protein